MPEKDVPVVTDILNFIIKVIVPALIGVGIKIAIEMEKKRMTIKRACISIAVGVGTAWLCSDIIHRHVEGYLQSLVIAVTAILSEKIAEYLLYKLDVDEWMGNIFSEVKVMIVNILTRSK